jgi:hypothetical protein
MRDGKEIIDPSGRHDGHDFYIKERIFDKRLDVQVGLHCFRSVGSDNLRLEVFEIDALERFFHMELSWFAVGVDSVPIEHTIRRV